MLLARKLLERPSLILAVTGAFAAASAAAKQWVGIGDGWNAIEFWQDVVQNGFLAILLTWLIKKVADYQADQVLRRFVLNRLPYIALAISGWNRIPDVQSTTKPLPVPTRAEVDRLLKEAGANWRNLAIRIEKIREASGASAHIEAFLELQTLHFSYYASYNAEGGRRRRMVWLRALTDDLASVESGGQSALAGGAMDCRRRATDVISWISHTDSVITERLLLERHFSPGSVTLPPSGVLFSTVDFDSSLASSAELDRTYLLFTHIAMVCSGIDLTDMQQETLGLLLDQVRRPLGAMRNELRAAAECADALVRLVDAAAPRMTTL